MPDIPQAQLSLTRGRGMRLDVQQQVKRCALSAKQREMAACLVSPAPVPAAPVSPAGLRNILESAGRFPAACRDLYWRFLLHMGADRDAFCAVRHETEGFVVRGGCRRALEKEGKASGIMEGIIKMLKLTLPDIDRQNWIPRFLRPVVRYYAHDQLAIYEMSLRLLWNWCRQWLGGEKGINRDYLKCVKRIVSACVEVTPVMDFIIEVVLPDQMEGLFSEIFRGENWLMFMDHILVESPQYLTVCCAALCIYISIELQNNKELITRNGNSISMDISGLEFSVRALFRITNRVVSHIQYVTNTLKDQSKENTSKTVERTLNRPRSSNTRRNSKSGVKHGTDMTRTAPPVPYYSHHPDGKITSEIKKRKEGNGKRMFSRSTSVSVDPYVSERKRLDFSAQVTDGEEWNQRKIKREEEEEKENVRFSRSNQMNNDNSDDYREEQIQKQDFEEIEDRNTDYNNVEEIKNDQQRHFKVYNMPVHVMSSLARTNSIYASTSSSSYSQNYGKNNATTTMTTTTDAREGIVETTPRAINSKRNTTRSFVGDEEQRNETNRPLQQTTIIHSSQPNSRVMFDDESYYHNHSRNQNPMTSMTTTTMMMSGIEKGSERYKEPTKQQHNQEMDDFYKTMNSPTIGILRQSQSQNMRGSTNTTREGMRTPNVLYPHRTYIDEFGSANVLDVRRRDDYNDENRSGMYGTNDSSNVGKSPLINTPKIYTVNPSRFVNNVIKRGRSNSLSLDNNDNVNNTQNGNERSSTNITANTFGSSRVNVGEISSVRVPLSSIYNEGVHSPSMTTTAGINANIAPNKFINDFSDVQTEYVDSLSHIKPKSVVDDTRERAREKATSAHLLFMKRLQKEVDLELSKSRLSNSNSASMSGRF